MTLGEWERIDPAVLCRKCGMRKGLHGGPTNPIRPFACPATEREPKWPKTIRDEKRAGAVFDERLRKHWSKRSTSYEPALGYY